MLKKVLLSADVFSFCAAHAFVTEKEEIMGLLIGEKVEEGIYSVSSALALKRSDKKSDRVEISPEQLSQATTHVEMLSEKKNNDLSIVGWYHSHPHITAMPSEVDIRTQASYQLLDQCFIGLILSVFNTTQSTKINRMQVSCFQSCLISPNVYERIDVETEVVVTHSICHSVIQSFNSLASIFYEEESEVFESLHKQFPQPPLTCLFNKSVFIKNLLQIMESIHIPVISMIEKRTEANKSRILSIKEEKVKLRAQLESQKTPPSTPLLEALLPESIVKPENINFKDINFSNTTKTIPADNYLYLTTVASPLTQSSSPNKSSNFHQNDAKSPKKLYGETSI